MVIYWSKSIWFHCNQAEKNYEVSTEKNLTCLKVLLRLQTKMQAVGSRVTARARQVEQRMVMASRPSVRQIVFNAAAFGVKMPVCQRRHELGRGGASTRKAPRSAVAGATSATPALDIVFVAAEVAPWSKTGGLGDVTGGLPIELVKRGHRVMTIAPR